MKVPFAPLAVAVLGLGLSEGAFARELKWKPKPRSAPAAAAPAAKVAGDNAEDKFLDSFLDEDPFGGGEGRELDAQLEGDMPALDDAMESELTKVRVDLDAALGQAGAERAEKAKRTGKQVDVKLKPEDERYLAARKEARAAKAEARAKAELAKAPVPTPAVIPEEEAPKAKASLDERKPSEARRKPAAAEVATDDDGYTRVATLEGDPEVDGRVDAAPEHDASLDGAPAQATVAIAATADDAATWAAMGTTGDATPRRLRVGADGKPVKGEAVAATATAETRPAGEEMVGRKAVAAGGRTTQVAGAPAEGKSTLVAGAEKTGRQVSQKAPKRQAQVVDSGRQVAGPRARMAGDVAATSNAQAPTASSRPPSPLVEEGSDPALIAQAMAVSASAATFAAPGSSGARALPVVIALAILAGAATMWRKRRG